MINQAAGFICAFIVFCFLWSCDFLFSDRDRHYRGESGPRRNTTEGPLLNQPIGGEAHEHEAHEMSTFDAPRTSQAPADDPTQAATSERHQQPAVQSRSISLSPDSSETSMPMFTFNVPRQASANDPIANQAPEDVPIAGTPDSYQVIQSEGRSRGISRKGTDKMFGSRLPHLHDFIGQLTLF
jgi:hypothetical protein